VVVLGLRFIRQYISIIAPREFSKLTIQFVVFSLFGWLF
jgi:hypothetical protein